MIVDDETEHEGADRNAAPFARAYDYFKHMTGVALVSIGGVFAFMDNDGPAFDTRRVVIVLACIGLSGVTSLLMANTLASTEVRQIPMASLARRIRYGLFAATFFLAIGLGAFIQTFMSAVGR